MVTRNEFEQANEQARRKQEREPRAISATYDRRAGRIVIQLSSNLGIMFSPHDAQGLEHATPAQLSRIEISPSGFGIHFPALDADFYLPALLEGIFGSEKWTSRLGRLGGQSRSAAKSLASRKNGKLGGRPRNVASA